MNPGCLALFFRSAVFRSAARPFAAVTMLLPSLCSGHGFAQRYDLPVPLWLYISGAAATVAVSFLVIVLFLRRTHAGIGYPRFNLLRVPLIRILRYKAVLRFVRGLSLAAFLLILIAGWIGVQEPFSNIAPTAVWVIWWVGFAYVSGLLGNLWGLVNPWKNAWLVLEYLIRRRNPGARCSMGFRLPPVVGVWPALLLFGLFIWLELVWRESDRPAAIASAALLYSLLSWSGMALFGRERWLQQGEVFTLVFGLLARFSVTEIRVAQPQACARCLSDAAVAAGEPGINCDTCLRLASPDLRQWNLRPPGIGLLTERPVSLSLTLFVLLMLAAVTFDGLMATPLWAALMQWALYSEALRPLLLGLQPLFGDALSALSSLGLVVFVLGFAVLYLLFCQLMRVALGQVEQRPGVIELAGCFVFTLLPIALAYHLAHYLSFLLIVGQYMIPLISDPFGFGWNLFGSASYFVDIGIVNARFVWFTSVIAIVIGHIAAIWLAHLTAQRLFNERRLVLRSQLPMLVLMVAYTMVSLWILAQPIVES